MHWEFCTKSLENFRQESLSEIQSFWQVGKNRAEIACILSVQYELKLQNITQYTSYKLETLILIKLRLVVNLKYNEKS